MSESSMKPEAARIRFEEMVQEKVFRCATGKHPSCVEVKLARPLNSVYVFFVPAELKGEIAAVIAKACGAAEKLPPERFTDPLAN